MCFIRTLWANLRKFILCRVHNIATSRMLHEGWHSSNILYKISIFKISFVFHDYNMGLRFEYI